MQYRIKVIEYESGRKEYVPQVSRWWGWKRLGDKAFLSEKLAMQPIRGNQYYTLKSVTYKPVKQYETDSR